LDELLFALAQRLDQTDVRHLIAVAAGYCTERRLTELLVDLAAILDSEGGAPAALELALNFRSPTYRADLLCGVFNRLNAADRERALVSLRSIEESAERERRLASVGHAVVGVTQIARRKGAPPPEESIRSEAEGSTCVEALDPMLQSLLEQAMSGDSRISTTSLRRFRMGGEGAGKDVMRLAQLQGLECETDRYSAIDKQLPTLTESELEDLIVALPRLVTESHQADLLGRIVDRAHGSQRDRMLDLALSLGDPTARKRAIQLVAPVVATISKPKLRDHWRDFLEEARKTDRHQLFSTLETMAPLLRSLGGDAGAIESIEAIDEIGRSWP
jgi:hypothetical protein